MEVKKADDPKVKGEKPFESMQDLFKNSMLKEEKVVKIRCFTLLFMLGVTIWKNLDRGQDSNDRVANHKRLMMIILFVLNLIVLGYSLVKRFKY